MIKSAYPVIKTKKIEETAKFYEKYFSFERSFSSDWYISLQSNGNELAIMDPDHETIPALFRGKPTAGEVILNFETNDVDAIYGKFIEDQRKIFLVLRDEPWGQRHFIAQDPNGIPLDVITVIPPSKEFLEQYS